MNEFRLRISFQKMQRTAFLSHLEVLHAVERIVRRAQLPYAITQGFHPHMKLAFGPALSVGVGSHEEYADIYITEFIKPDDALARMQKAAPDSLSILKVGYVNPKEPSLTASLTILSYCAKIFAPTIKAKEIEDILREARSSDTLEVVQKEKTKVFNPALCIPKDAKVTQDGDDVKVVFAIRISPSGSLRPEALIDYVFDQANAKYSHLSLTRIGLYSETDEGPVRPL